MADWHAAATSSSPSSSSSPHLPFNSRRSPVLCTHGCVSTSQPLATSIGLYILRSYPNSNAADAAIAVAAALAVMEPCSTGLGGDMFALYYESKERKVHAVNGSGRCPGGLTLERIRKDFPSKATSSSGAIDNENHAGDDDGEGGDGGDDNDSTYLEQSNQNCGIDVAQFETSVHSVTVPGAARGWEDFLTRHGSGTLTLAELVEPAAKLAEEGFPVSPLTSFYWREGMGLITRWYNSNDGSKAGEGASDGDGEGANKKAREAVPLSIDGSGRGPSPGEIFRNPNLARVLRSLGQHGATDGFYNNFPGKAIVSTIQRHGGVMTLDDLIEHTTTYPEAISVDYRNVKLWQVPPNGQGIAGLIALSGLQSLEQSGMIPTIKGEDDLTPKSAQTMHGMIECMRLGFADARSFVCDPDFHPPSGDDKDRTTDKKTKSNEWLLDPNRIANRVNELFNSQQAVVQNVELPRPSGTVSFQVVDSKMNAVSFVNSNFCGFGTGLVPEGCGFTLQNRGAGFNLDPAHPNALEPKKRPYHTIIPGMMTHADTEELYATMSNMGGYMQPQGHMQLTVNLVAGNVDPQTAVDLPRFCIADGTKNGVVMIEEGVSEEVVRELKTMGHDMKSDVGSYEKSVFGRAQIIKRDRETGVLWAGSDGRADGCAMGY